MPQHKGSKDRGRLPFCKACLSPLSRENKNVAKLTCQQRIERLKNDPVALRGRRIWWEGVKDRDPEWARTFLLQSEWVQAELEEFLNPPNSRKGKNM